SIASSLADAAINPDTSKPSSAAAWPIQLAQGGEGGEGGEAGQSGEAGIDVTAAARDPLAFNIALQVIAAHVHAGIAAYAAGEKEAGAQMFAHGLSEVF